MSPRPVVCVVDDEASVRGVICAALRRAGFDTVEAANGQGVVALVAGSGACVAVVDLIMPDKEGLETIHELKANAPDIRILAISGGGTAMLADTLLMTARELGADEFIAKPFAMADFVARVTRLAASVGEARAVA